VHEITAMVWHWLCPVIDNGQCHDKKFFGHAGVKYATHLCLIGTGTSQTGNEEGK